MQPDTTINLGAFQFALFEIPERISWGGSQRIAVHELVGGQRQLQAMGRSDRALVWSGLFMGLNATERARFLDTMRAQGLPQTLAFGQLAYSVLVKEFEPDYERFYQIPYRIELAVISDLASPITSVAPASIDSDILTDYDASNLLAGQVGDAALTSLLGALGAAIGTVARFATASRSTVSSVQQPLSSVAARVAVLTASSGGVLGSVSSFGGVQPGGFGSASAENLRAQSSNMTQFNALLQLTSIVGRMTANLRSVSTAPNTVTTAGGNLFTISQQQYGDATEWTGIAKANGLTDPFIQGTQTLNIPAQPDNTDGVLDA